ncbi:MAG: hypothetical protein HGA45_31850 [Chloroflexales bacterium]|nr:hypothetical protein [Chloroflexales bacterium]
MTMLSVVPNIWIGLIGWVATLLVITNAARLTIRDRRILSICSWMLWMLPAFGLLVYRGVIPLATATLYIGATTSGMGIVMCAITGPRTDP